MSDSNHVNYGRAGYYAQQPDGYKAFLPKPLPPEPPVRITGKLQVLLSQADRMLGRLDGSIHTLPDADWFVYMYVRKEAVLSSQIEGTQSSLQDLLAAESDLPSNDRPQDVDEVINYVRAMNYGLRQVGELSVSVQLIRELHQQLLEGVRGSHLQPGALRSTQNWIGPLGCTLNEAIFVPPPPEEVPRCLAEWEQFIHGPNDLPLLIKIGLAHAQFATIHPFLDGNGRIGRLLITFLLCEREILIKPVLYLSYFFKRYRGKYYERLQAVRDEGDYEQWLIFFLRGIVEVSRQAAETARNILELREKHRGIVAEHFHRSAGSGHRALEYLYKHPIVSVQDIQAVIGRTYSAANDLVARFEGHGILQEVTGHSRNRRFRYDSYIRLFEDNLPAR